MRLIDANELKEWVENWLTTNKYYHPHSKSNNIPIIELYDILEHIPTVDTELVNGSTELHGHWIMLHKTHNVDEDNDYDWRCSECNHVDCHNINVEVPYCWYCGAKMDEAEKDE